MPFPRYSLFIFVVFMLLIACGMIWFDRPVALYFRALDHDAPYLVAPFKTITALGKSEWFLYPTATIFAVALCAMRFQPLRRIFWRGLAQKSGFVFADIALTGLTVDLLKILIGRPRPVLLPEGIFNQFTPLSFHARWWSFPSGHSATMMAAALSLGVIFPRWRLPLWSAAGLIAASRIVVAAHYPSDVMGGLIVAAAMHTLLCQRLIRWGWLAKNPDGGFFFDKREISPCQNSANRLNPPHEIS